MTYHPDEPSPKLVCQLALEFVANIGKLGMKERIVIIGILDQAAKPLVTVELPVKDKKPPLNSVPNIPKLKVVSVIQNDNTRLEITNVKMLNKEIVVYVK